jgi:hypothetical protein
MHSPRLSLCAAILFAHAPAFAAPAQLPPCPVAAAVASSTTTVDTIPATPGQLIVIGFMGGNVSANNLVHREALVARNLQQINPKSVVAEVFANGDSNGAMKAILLLLDRNRDGCIDAQERSAARIVLFGHSWGASEAITLARRLDDLNIPVLLTIQVDSVEKFGENDDRIPSNVQQAVNYYQTEGLLHGRTLITAIDPGKTSILGNFVSSYKTSPVNVAEFPWYARAFMHSHIEIENDPVLWGKIQTLIQAKVI